MIRNLVGTLVARIRGFWDLQDPEERIEGSGEVHLDPAYNGRYTAERRLRELSKAQEEAADGTRFETAFDGPTHGGGGRSGPHHR